MKIKCRSCLFDCLRSVTFRTTYSTHGGKMVVVHLHSPEVARTKPNHAFIRCVLEYQPKDGDGPFICHYIVHAISCSHQTRKKPSIPLPYTQCNPFHFRCAAMARKKLVSIFVVSDTVYGWENKRSPEIYDRGCVYFCSSGMRTQNFYIRSSRDTYTPIIVFTSEFHPNN